MTTRARLPLVCAAGGKAYGIEGIHCGRSGGSEAYRHAIAGGRFAIAGAGDDESRLVTTVEHPAVAERAKVLDAEGTQGGIVKRARLPDVGGTEKDMREDGIAGNDGSGPRKFSLMLNVEWMGRGLMDQ